ncbi:uncharacterized protein MYCFIDRAFT_177289 [Pseudocercospora fijiensis CIRAD86]|uniref:Uncharacterized protein n=1 Tax=Pseudocercospora fijiensis (strain CIRAD86) TaxID=383855 RepID=M3AS73_PSEFD|nr:uncharacterized protein MYCFIDRAFT_177289 [Pseudocercospora fijiensis CIRAD86]EME80337.1 hypothetical protein MYCFIDRAFT_177289 [Pseudocercospora fijiensis CIRAD86]
MPMPSLAHDKARLDHVGSRPAWQSTEYTRHQCDRKAADQHRVKTIYRWKNHLTATGLHMTTSGKESFSGSLLETGIVKERGVDMALDNDKRTDSVRIALLLYALNHLIGVVIAGPMQSVKNNWRPLETDFGAWQRLAKGKVDDGWTDEPASQNLSRQMSKMSDQVRENCMADVKVGAEYIGEAGLEILKALLSQNRSKIVREPVVFERL